MRTRISTFIVVLFLFFGFAAPALQVSLPDLNNGNVRWSGHPMDDSAALSLRPMRRRMGLASQGLMVLFSARSRLRPPTESRISDIDLQEILPFSTPAYGSSITRAPPSAPVL